MMTTPISPLPQKLATTAGPLPEPGSLRQPYPYETVTPHREGFVERGVVVLTGVVLTRPEGAEGSAGAGPMPRPTIAFEEVIERVSQQGRLRPVARGGQEAQALGLGLAHGDLGADHAIMITSFG